jgi:hypothetical protein
MSGTTVVQKFNQGTLPPIGGIKRRGPFLGNFLGKQKGTKQKTFNLFTKRFNDHISPCFYFVIIIFGLKIFLTNGVLLAQDKVFLLNGDSVEAKIPGDPYKATGLNKRAVGSKGDYGFLQVVAIYANDSIRIHTPEQIKGYRKTEVGKYLGSGYFESRDLDTRLIGYGKRGELRPVFLQRVIEVPDYTIWYYREPDEGSILAYFLIQKTGDASYQVLTRWKNWLLWAENTPPFSEIIKDVAPPKRKRVFPLNGFSYMQTVFGKYRDNYTATSVGNEKQ